MIMYHSGHHLSAVSRMDVQLTSKSSSHKSPLPGGSPHLCEDGRAYVTDPISGRQVCMCSLMVGPDMHYTHMNMGPEARKQGAIPGAGGPPCIGFDTSAFCSPVLRGLPMRQDRIPPYLTSGLPGQGMTFDPALAGHPYGLLYSGMDVNGPMRKAATRETTGPLKAWLSDHKKNPYPTKAEKIMLAIITRMTLTQVSTWFANARRRLKKENKLYPGERDSRADDDDDDGDDYSDRQKDGSIMSLRPDSEKRSPSNSDNEDVNVDGSDCSDDDDDDDLVLEKHQARHFDPGYAYGQGQGRSWTSTADASQDDFEHNKHTPASSASDLSMKFSTSGAASSQEKRESPGDAQSSSGVTPKPKIWSISEIMRPSSSGDALSSSHEAQERSMPTLALPKTILSPGVPSRHAPLTSSHLFPPPLLTLPHFPPSSLTPPPAFRQIHNFPCPPNLFLHISDPHAHSNRQTPSSRHTPKTADGLHASSISNVCRSPETDSTDLTARCENSPDNENSPKSGHTSESRLLKHSPKALVKDSTADGARVSKYDKPHRPTYFSDSSQSKSPKQHHAFSGLASNTALLKRASTHQNSGSVKKDLISSSRRHDRRASSPAETNGGSDPAPATEVALNLQTTRTRNDNT
ncbi:unnamed protein product [Lymnaea stagnalis]|uniref:Homeobox domain-containing protein n=1 Tax=Lymnaea stagnalis TaxID=6523 RepID=A0AAV2HWL1_LYMST